MSQRSLRREWEACNSAESEIKAKDSEQAIEELGDFGDPLLSRFQAAPNSVCCSYCTSPAVL
jgi:hypothetical protein